MPSSQTWAAPLRGPSQRILCHEPRRGAASCYQLTGLGLAAGARKVCLVSPGERSREVMLLIAVHRPVTEPLSSPEPLFMMDWWPGERCAVTRRNEQVLEACRPVDVVDRGSCGALSICVAVRRQRDNSRKIARQRAPTLRANPARPRLRSTTEQRLPCVPSALGQLTAWCGRLLPRC
jgi:hypothetical protein